jgi:vacuolar-type H+-ATPase subunit H
VADETITDDRTTKDRATDVATAAREEARSVAGDARGEAAAVVSEAGTQARALADEARHALRQQASDGTSRAAGAVDQLAGNLRALAEGNTEQAGDLQRYVRDLGDRLGGVAGRLQERGLDGAVDDVQSFARRRPGLFLVAAAGAGFAAGRLFRGAKAEAESSGDGAGTWGNGHGVGSELPAAGSPVTTAGGLTTSSQGAAGGPTTALPVDPGDVPGPSIDEQERAAELSGFRPEPPDAGVERAGPEGGTTPAPRPYGGATGGSGGAP